MKKRFIICLNILSMLIISSIALFSYAFVSPIVNSSKKIEYDIPIANGIYNFTVSNASNLNINLTIDNYLLGEISDTVPIASSNANLEVKLQAADNKSRVVCTYDLVWEWTNDYYPTVEIYFPREFDIVPYPTSLSYDYEMSINVNGTTNTPNSNTFGYNLNEIRLDYFFGIDSSNSSTIVERNIITSNSSNVPTITNWNIETNIYRMPIDQKNLSGKNFKAKVYVSNVDCQLYPLLVKPEILSGDLSTPGSEIQIGYDYFYVLGDDETNSSNIKLFTKEDIRYNCEYDNTNDQGIYGHNYCYTPVSRDFYWYDEDDSEDDGDYIKSEYTQHSCEGDSEYYYYEDSLCYYVYDYNLDLYEPIETYKDLLIYRYGLDVKEARLISYDEADDIIMTEWGRAYGTYWTGSIDTNYLDYWVVMNDDGFELSNQNYGSGEDEYGIRPVIVVSKSIFN